MDLFEAMRSRRSVRSYCTTEISEADLTAVLEAMSSAPSAGNLQAYDVVVVRDAERRRRLAHAAARQQFVAEAPLVMVFFMSPERARFKYGRRADTLYACQDATIAAAYAQLAALARGLSSVWVGAFDDEEVKRIVAAPEGLRPTSMLVLGYAAERPEPTSRRAIDDLVRRETY